MYATDPSGRSAKPVKVRQVSSGTDATDEEGYRVRVTNHNTSALSRIGMVFAGFLLAAMILFTLTGYERITRAYADVNVLNNAIDETNLRIAALDVQIECAVTIRDAQEAAERLGMQYPSPSQYVRVGDYIPITTVLPSDTVGTETSIDTLNRGDAVNAPIDNVGINPAEGLDTANSEGNMSVLPTTPEAHGDLEG